MLYSALPLDRSHALRHDEEALAGLRASPHKRVVPYWREKSLVGEAGAVLAQGTAAAELLDLGRETVFLGHDAEDAPVFAADLSHQEAAGDGSGPALGLAGTWMGLRGAGALLSAAEASLLGYARATLIWHRRNRFCGSCGAPTEAREGGHMRQCTDPACAAPTYPRTDPAVIMLVADGDKVLLHRQRLWTPGQWSILAGFVEPAETLEEAVAREVMEETGIRVSDVTYRASQPWPFPSSVMVGFTARAAGGVLAPDPQEVEDARWFSRETILAEFDDRHRGKGTGLCLPMRDSIARSLLEEWLGGRL